MSSLCISPMAAHALVCIGFRAAEAPRALRRARLLSAEVRRDTVRPECHLQGGLLARVHRPLAGLTEKQGPRLAASHAKRAANTPAFCSCTRLHACGASVNVTAEAYACASSACSNPARMFTFALYHSCVSTWSASVVMRSASTSCLETVWHTQAAQMQSRSRCRRGRCRQGAPRL